MLTLDKLKELPKGEIFARGETTNSPDGIYMTNERIGDKLCWVAKTGGINDWAIYTYWAEYGENYALRSGQKVGDINNIKKLVPCDDEAFNRYRQ